jgi:hypothetical protein
MSQAKEWEDVILGWRGLGVHVNVCDVEWLLQIARGSGDLTRLAARLSTSEADSVSWLTRLLDLLVATPSANANANAFDGVLPDQCGAFRARRDLCIDSGVPEKLKDAGASLGLEFRRELLHQAIISTESTGRQARQESLERALQKRFGALEAARRIVDAVRSKLLEEQKLARAGSRRTESSALRPSIEFLVWLAGSALPEARGMAHTIPLVTAAGDIQVSSGAARIVLPPRIRWPREVADYADVFPEQRLLSDKYFQYAGEQYEELHRALVGWDLMWDSLVVPQPGASGSVSDIEELLAGTAPEGRGHEFDVPDLSSIPFLSPDVLGRVGQSQERGRLFLEFLRRRMCSVQRGVTLTASPLCHPGGSLPYASTTGSPLAIPTPTATSPRVPPRRRLSR